MDKRVEVIEKIVEYAKDKIDQAGCSTVDSIAYRIVDLLEELEEGEAAERVCEYYEKVWGDSDDEEEDD